MKKRILLAILSGILFSLAWTQWGLGLSLLVAFIPLLFIEEEIYQLRTEKRSIQIFYYAYLSFFTWNLLSTWWVSNSTLFGGVTAVVLNSLFYAVLFWLFHVIKRKMGPHTGYSSLIILWLAFETVYINGEISWVWLILGNGFANNTELIQWYEYTGALGGSLWILLINIFVFNFIQHLMKYKTLYGQYIFTGVLLFTLLFPIITSKVILNRYEEKNDPISVSIVQPNIDPFFDKFSGMSQDQQMNKMFRLIEEHGDKNADFIILPETAVEKIWENDFYESRNIARIQAFVNQRPQSSMVFGATTRYLYTDGSQTATSRIYRPQPELQYDVFNTALQMNYADSLQKYHKSKLVIGAEMTPYPAIFNIFKDYVLDLGGISGNLGKQDFRSVFINSNNKAKVAPVVCYESIYGEFVTDYVKAGANVIFIITNDAWWGDTPGYRQHLSFAKLRAIECRRSIARSANTGISAIINQKGEIEEHTDYWVEDVLNGEVNLNNETTYYVQNGDFIGRIAKFLTFLLLLSFGISYLRHKKS